MPEYYRFFGRQNVKTFLFFLLITSILWLFIQFSKKYTNEVTVNVRYSNLPKDRMIHKDSDQKLNLTLSGNGFRLLTQRWDKKEIVFDFANAISKKRDVFYFLINKDSPKLQHDLGFEGEILEVQKDTLKIKLQRFLEKKVPVRLISQIQYIPGYSSDRGGVLSPDSTWVSGPYHIVDGIKEVLTVNTILKGVNTDRNQKVLLDTTTLATSVRLDINEVVMDLEVDKFTEGHQIIPVTLLNVPNDKEVKIFPKEVAVYYRVALSKYNQIRSKDFRVIATYDESKNNEMLLLELQKKPTGIHDVRLREKRVQYVILN